MILAPHRIDSTAYRAAADEAANKGQPIEPLLRAAAAGRLSRRGKLRDGRVQAETDG